MLHHLVILMVPCLAIIMAPLIVFVLLAQFYRLSAWQALQFMAKQLVHDNEKKQLQPELVPQKKRRRNKKHKRA